MHPLSQYPQPEPAPKRRQNRDSVGRCKDDLVDFQADWQGLSTAASAVPFPFNLSLLSQCCRFAAVEASRMGQVSEGNALLLLDARHKSFSMQAKELILLSPHRFPTDTSPILGSEEIACFLNAWSSLWHPAVLLGAAEPPRVASPYDHENPIAGCLYALPESPAMVLPDDWPQRLADVGAFSYKALPDKSLTLTRLREALPGAADGPAHWDLSPERLAPFFALGFGFAIINTLFEAMEHANVLAVADFWKAMQQAAEAVARGDQTATDQSLQAAADCLRRCTRGRVSGRDLLARSLPDRGQTGRKALPAIARGQNPGQCFVRCGRLRVAGPGTAPGHRRSSRGCGSRNGRRLWRTVLRAR